MRPNIHVSIANRRSTNLVYFDKARLIESRFCIMSSNAKFGSATKLLINDNRLINAAIAEPNNGKILYTLHQIRETIFVRKLKLLVD